MNDNTKNMYDLVCKMFSVLPMYGSLWRVPEEIWISRYTSKRVSYDMKSTRQSHPGCLVSNNDNNGMLTMLQGFSKKHNRWDVQVDGVYDSKRKTYFGGMPPVQIPVKCWRVANESDDGITPVSCKILSRMDISKIKNLMRMFPWKI